MCQPALSDNWAPLVGLSLVDVIHPLTSTGHTCSVPLDDLYLESSAVPPLYTSVLFSKNVALLLEFCLLRLNWSCITKAHSGTACPAASCSSTCMWQGMGIYAPLLPVLLSLNLSFCSFFTSLLHQSLFFFFFFWTNSCSKYFQYPFWSHELMLTHFIVCGSGPHGEFVNGRLAQPALFLKHAAHILHYRSYHRSLGPDITILQEWSHFFLPHSSSHRGGGDILPQ